MTHWCLLSCMVAFIHCWLQIYSRRDIWHCIIFCLITFWYSDLYCTFPTILSVQWCTTWVFYHITQWWKATDDGILTGATFHSQTLPLLLLLWLTFIVHLFCEILHSLWCTNICALYTLLILVYAILTFTCWWPLRWSDAVDVLNCDDVVYCDGDVTFCYIHILLFMRIKPVHWWCCWAVSNCITVPMFSIGRLDLVVGNFGRWCVAILPVIYYIDGRLSISRLLRWFWPSSLFSSVHCWKVRWYLLLFCLELYTFWLYTFVLFCLECHWLFILLLLYDTRCCSCCPVVMYRWWFGVICLFVVHYIVTEYCCIHLALEISYVE